MSIETTAAPETLPDVSDLKVVEITIRSNVPNVGKTMLASRLARVIKNEFGVNIVLIDNAGDDIHNATNVINAIGAPRIPDVHVVIHDDNQPIDAKTTRILAENRHLVPPIVAVTDETAE